MIHRDRPGYRVNSKPTSVIVTVSVDHPTTTNICNGLCDGLCTFSVDRTIKANSLCAHNVHGRSCCVNGCRDLFVVIDGLAPTPLQKKLPLKTRFFIPVFAKISTTLHNMQEEFVPLPPSCQCWSPPRGRPGTRVKKGTIRADVAVESAGFNFDLWGKGWSTPPRPHSQMVLIFANTGPGKWTSKTTKSMIGWSIDVDLPQF